MRNDKAGWRRGLAIVLAGTIGVGGPARAQVQSVDPNEALSQGNTPVPAGEANYGTDVPASAAGANPAATGTIPPPMDSATPGISTAGGAVVGGAAAAPAAGDPAAAGTATGGTTYQKGDVINAAEGVFGKGAEGLAKMIETILKDQGEPNAYIAGHEAGGALVLGLRYGSGTMTHKVEGQYPVYWTGPSIGLDAGANGAKTFILVYNLWDSEDLYKRYPAVEGNAYVIGGFTASYLRSGSVVLIPIRLGVGWRLGVNAGYMKFTKKSRWLPF